MYSENVSSCVLKYIESKSGAWSSTTLCSELSRLRAVAGRLMDEPSVTYNGLVKQGMKPYSIKTTFIRIGAFIDWCIDNDLYKGANLYKRFLKEKSQLFRNAYKKERINVSFKDAKYRISQIKTSSTRKLAEQILISGMRARESLTRSENMVIGKRGIQRFVNTQEGPIDSNISYAKLYRDLRKVGLKPHTLRKLFATKLVNAGFKEHDLLEAMGWKSMQTAASYLQPTKEAELRDKIRKALL